ncbi:MAG: hypothetical protein CLLPBCKN_006708 [Chroococcidiopsis cubana SAG 39.79]|nr:hypothetical protein [Chroococcidiopsis cubana SAG 39.79]PSB50482.1 hypothetical protein C7B79_36855 [Chroococcidiopsis cubana CCALA 043]
MAGVAAQRWRIEECFQFAKDQLGLGDYEVRSWTGWHRHVTLVLAAGAIFVGVAFSSRTIGRTLNSAIFFSSRRGWLWRLRSKRPVDSRPAQSSRTQAMGLEVAISPLLVFGIAVSLVNRSAGIIKLSLATIITVNAPNLPKIIYNCSAVNELCTHHQSAKLPP